MKNKTTFLILSALLIFSVWSCQGNRDKRHEKNQIPVFNIGLIQWEKMNDSEWRNVSFPTWFSDSIVREKAIESMVLTSYNFQSVDSMATAQDSFPVQKTLLKFDELGRVKEMGLEEYDGGIKIATHNFFYPNSRDSLGYSEPVYTTKSEFYEEEIMQIFQAMQNAQQFQKLVVKNEDTAYLAFINRNKSPDEMHYFITDSTNWNVSFIDHTLVPNGQDVIYYGTPTNYVEAFQLENLVEKKMKERRFYFSNTMIDKQYFYQDGLMSKRYFEYDSIGVCTGFIDSMMVDDEVFLYREIVTVEYENKLPVLMRWHRDNRGNVSGKQIHFSYNF